MSINSFIIICVWCVLVVFTTPRFFSKVGEKEETQ